MFKKYSWIVFGHQETVSELQKLFKQVFEGAPILTDSKIYFLLSENKFLVKVQEVFRYVMESPLNFENFGYFEGQSFHNLRTLKVDSIRRKNLNGITLRASLVITNNDSINHLYDYK